jgi:hypothetical protein
MPVEGVNGILNVESAALHAPQVGVANTNPQHILSVGSNLYVSGDSPDVLTVDGNVVCEGVKVGLIEIIPSYDLEAVANVGNSTSNTIRFTNPDTGIVATGNVSVGKDLNVTGNLNVLGTTTTIDTENLRVKDPIIELGKDNAGTGDLGLIMTRPSGSSNVAVIFDENADTLEIGYTDNDASATDITMVSTPLSVNINGDLSITSNLEVGTANLFVDTTTGNVGIGKTDPGSALDVVGDVDIVGTVTTTNLIRGVVEEAVRWNSQNETVFPQSASTRYYKIATLGTTGGGANGGKLRISGTIGGFGEDETTLIDGFVASRQSIRFGGTLTGYGSDNPSDVDFVVYEESDGTFAVWLKVIRYFVFDFTIMGAQVSNNTRTLAVLPCPTSDTSVTTPTGTLQGSVVDSCSVVFTADGNVGIGTTNPSSQLELYGAGKDLTFKYDTGITRRSAATRDGYYSGLENSIKRVGDRNIFDGSSFTPDTTHEILFGFSDTYSQYSGLDQYYPSYNEMRFKLWSPSSSTVGSLTDVMTLRGDGNVGIGSTSPGALLDLYGPKDAAAFKFKITDDTSNLTFRLGMKAGTSGYTDGWTTIDPNGSTSTGIAIFDALYVQGTLSVSSTKNFLIDHPLQPTAKKLVHAAVESPRVDLIYRGTTQLKDGRAIVNIDRQCVGDESCAMEDGTFEALCRDPVYYLQNTTDFNRLIGTIDKNLLTIISEDVNSIAIVNWMVVAERKDRDILESSQTNDNGRLNTEIIESSERVNRDGSVRYPST